MNNFLLGVFAALTLSVLGCDRPRGEPPPPSDRTARPLEPVRIDVVTALREIEIEVERLEEMQANEATAKMVALQPEQLRNVSNMIERARSNVDVKDELVSGEFQRFRKQALEKLDAFEARIEALQTRVKKETPAKDAGVK